jgi:hypothetical protein
MLEQLGLKAKDLLTQLVGALQKLLVLGVCFSDCLLKILRFDLDFGAVSGRSNTVLLSLPLTLRLRADNQVVVST